MWLKCSKIKCIFLGINFCTGTSQSPPKWRVLNLSCDMLASSGISGKSIPLWYRSICFDTIEKFCVVQHPLFEGIKATLRHTAPIIQSCCFKQPSANSVVYIFITSHAVLQVCAAVRCWEFLTIVSLYHGGGFTTGGSEFLLHWAAVTCFVEV